jgi:hypothetical protein
MLRARLRLGGGLLLVLLVSGSSSDAQLRPRYVLLLSSFDQQFSPHNVFTAVFRTELTLRSPEPVQFIDVSLPSTKGPRDDAETTLDYLKTTFALHRPDLIVSVGGVAALFAQQHRQQIFPQTPIMFSSVDQRFVRNRTLSPNETAVSVSVDAPRLVDNILHVLPATTTLAVVVGSSPVDLKWRDALMQSFQPFAKRLTFIWLNDLSFEDTLKRCASLPPNSAILFAHLGVDARGVPQVELGVIETGLVAGLLVVHLKRKRAERLRQDVALHANGDGLQLEVVDQGKGFNPEAALMHDGLGLVSMRERLYLIGGELVVQSRPGKGTTVRAHVRNAAPA